ncbi:hypothetical protein [Streptosporangium sp. NPDC002607]
MRILVTVIAATALLAACTPSVSNIPEAKHVTKTTIPGARQTLADISQGVKTKILLHHVEKQGQASTWSTDIKVGTSFRLATDCVGADGIMMVRVGKSQFPRRCSTGPGDIRTSTIPNRIEVSRIAVEAPLGAEWSILIARPSKAEQ